MTLVLDFTAPLTVAGYVLLAILMLNVACLTAGLLFAAFCALRAIVHRLLGIKSLDQLRDEWVDTMYRRDEP